MNGKKKILKKMPTEINFIYGQFTVSFARAFCVPAKIISNYFNKLLLSVKGANL